jgi:hypothetical protein
MSATVDADSLGACSKYLYTLVVDKSNEVYLKNPHYVCFFGSILLNFLWCDALYFNWL